MTDYLIKQGERYASDLAEAFSTWERRGRGWQIWDYAVSLEPSFSPIKIPPPNLLTPSNDDARLQGGLGRLFGRNLTRPNQLTDNNQRPSEISETDQASVKPMSFYRSEEITEMQILLPQDLDVSPALNEQFWLSLISCPSPMSFEFVADQNQIIAQIACDTCYASHLKNQLETFFSSLYLNQQKGFLTSHFDSSQAIAIADFGLSRNFLLPLNTFRSFNPDPLTGLISSLGSLQRGEKALFQVMFQPTRLVWTEELQKLQTNSHLKKLLQEKNPAVLTALKEKLSSTLFAVVIRLATQSVSRSQNLEILKRIGVNLTRFSSPNSNELFALSNDSYSENNHRLSIFSRTSYRSGMILNASELTALAHMPSASVKVKKFKRDEQKTKAAPPFIFGHCLILGENLHDGQSRQISLSNEQRTRHLHIIGSTGSGKSTLLLNLIKQDLETGQGFCVIDPHGDLIDDALANIPESRLQDVILFDPANAEFPLGLNILHANSELEKNLMSSDLVATFRRMSTSWGDVMDSVLANAILAFIESERGGTLFDLKRFLVEKDFRNDFLKTVSDEAIKYFWINEFPLVSGKSPSSILIRLDTFLRNRMIRNIVCQKQTRLDFRLIMDSKKVLLIKLSQGLIGEENAYLLGTLLVSKLYQTALSRQDSRERPYFWLYMDEFHHFITPSMESILSGVRKYNLGLVLAHQEFRQLQSRSSEVASSVLSNCYTRICFRLGDTDAEKFASGFSFFDAKALQNLGVGEAIMRVERAEFDCNLKTLQIPKVDRETAGRRKQSVLQNTRANYSKPKAEVEAELMAGKPVLQEPVTAKVKEFVQAKTESPIEKQPKAADTEAQKKSKAPAEFSGIVETVQSDSSHRYLQGIIKKIGENSGFVATLEKEVFGGAGKIDVALEHEHLKIACEVAVTNTVDYELQNIQKCLASGFDKVVVISTDSKHLAHIRRRAEAVISAPQLEKMYFLEPDNFHLFLETIRQQINTKNKIKGYTVNVDFNETKDKETASRKQTLFEILSNAIRRKGRK